LQNFDGEIKIIAEEIENAVDFAMRSAFPTSLELLSDVY
jgi:hypothetical protein